MNNCECKTNGGIVKVTIFQTSDVVIENNSFRLKRKYGKFKRPAIHIDYREPEIIGLS